MTITLDAAVREELGRIDNASDFISRTIGARLAAATAAMRFLRFAGWTRDEVLIAERALRGFDFSAMGTDGRLLAAELEGALITHAIEVEDLSTWRTRANRIRGDAGEAHALGVVVQELVAGNEIVRASVQAMQGGRRVEPGVLFVDVPLDVRVIDGDGQVVAGPFAIGRGQRVDLGFPWPPNPLRLSDLPWKPSRFRFAIDDIEMWGVEVDAESTSIPKYRYEFFIP